MLGLLAVLILLEVWGVDAFAWFSSDQLGGRALGAVIVIGVTLAAAMLVWEAVNGSVERQLARLSREGHVTRAARLRTLLPMMRATLFVVIVIVVGLMVLSEIGVNIAPLLAGAGIVGIAIGFGAQKLVQDIITGLFLLIENAMQVGDVVSLGGLNGVVENLSIRTIRLRASDGSVHIVPFSAVTSVTNMTRDFSYALFNVGVAYKEDVDRVIAVLKEIAAEMRKEPEWAAMIRDDLEVWGLDQFAASSVVVVCRLRTGPAQRWAVMREFNRRMKKRFDELGIEMPFPHQKLVLDQPVTLYHLAPGRQCPARSPPMTLADPLADLFHVLAARRLRVRARPSHARALRGGRETPLADWPAFAASWDDLGLDVYMADGGRYRRRRFGVFAAAAGGGPILRALHQPHYQSRDYNALNGGIERWFAPIAEAVGAGPSMRAILATTRSLFDRLAPEPRLAYRGAPVPHRGAPRRGGPADARGHAPRRRRLRARAADPPRERPKRRHLHPRPRGPRRSAASPWPSPSPPPSSTTTA